MFQGDMGGGGKRTGNKERHPSTVVILVFTRNCVLIEGVEGCCVVALVTTSRGYIHVCEGKRTSTIRHERGWTARGVNLSRNWLYLLTIR